MQEDAQEEEKGFSGENTPWISIKQDFDNNMDNNMVIFKIFIVYN